MSKKLVLVFAVIYFFSYFNLVWARVVISEVKISPIEDRFIKLYNQDNSVVDLSNWYIQRKTQNGSKFDSLVTSTYFKDKKIKAKSYFLISRNSTEEADIVLGGLTLTESNAIQIKNGDGEVVDKVCWGDISDCSSSFPNPSSGQSIEIVNQDTSVQEVLPDSNIATTDNSSTQTTSETKTKKAEIPKIKTEILGKTFGFVGIPLSLEAVSFGLEGEQLPYGKYFWNFGDGDSRETKTGENQKFSHTYFYPGDYIVSLDFYSSFYSISPDASNKINIKIVPANISISRVGGENDFFVELSNNAAYEVNLSNWILISGEKNFVLPRNTILEAEGKIILSPRITLFSIADKNNLKLMTPGREVVFEYQPLPTSPNQELATIQQPPKSPLSRGLAASPDKGRSGGVGDTAFVSPPEDLMAGVIASDIANNNVTSKSSTIIFSLIFLVFLGVSASAVYFIRQSRRVPQAGDDFAILDE